MEMIKESFSLKSRPGIAFKKVWCGRERLSPTLPALSTAGWDPRLLQYSQESFYCHPGSHLTWRGILLNTWKRNNKTNKTFVFFDHDHSCTVYCIGWQISESYKLLFSGSSKMNRLFRQNPRQLISIGLWQGQVWQVFAKEDNLKICPLSEIQWWHWQALQSVSLWISVSPVHPLLPLFLIICQAPATNIPWCYPWSSSQHRETQKAHPVLAAWRLWWTPHQFSATADVKRAAKERNSERWLKLK